MLATATLLPRPLLSFVRLMTLVLISLISNVGLTPMIATDGLSPAARPT